jgi:deoxyribodipyrimidine photo-lyase
MRRDFANRDELIDYLQKEFSASAAVADHVPPVAGGRTAAKQLLTDIDPAAYETNRNFLDGAVTRLSPYLRHGLLSLSEVRDAVMSATQGSKIGKLVQELAWRDFFQRIYAQIGSAVWQDREPYKTGFSAADYSDELPQDIKLGQTGLACIDAFSHQLIQSGYLHNHARMWLAGYIVHWRRVKWQAGAHWFLQHLLDGDPASNNLSWQWVASTFSHKPYFFNRANIEKFSGGQYCHKCPLYGSCAFEGSYPALERRLFPHKPPAPPPKPRRSHAKKGKRWHQ